MKYFICFYCCLSSLYYLNAQIPPPPKFNINEIGETKSIWKDNFVIDSTSKLEKIAYLKDLKTLKLDLALEKIPKEFEGFTKLESLNINGQGVLNDLSGLVYFPNLKSLQLTSYNGTTLLKSPLQLDSLQYVQILSAPQLQNIDALANLTALTELHLLGAPNIKIFPQFNKQNRLRLLRIDNYGVNLDKDTNRTDLSHLKYLTALESIYLSGFTNLREIPANWSKNITEITIHGGYGLGNQRMQTIRHLSAYPKLKKVEINNVYLEKIEGNFENLSLDYLRLERILNLTDISGIFTFKQIKKLQIHDAPYLEYIKGKNRNAIINELELSQVERLNNINFLFQCPNIQSLVISNAASSLIIPELEQMDKIPNITLSGEPHYYFYKKYKVWMTTKY